MTKDAEERFAENMAEATERIRNRSCLRGCAVIFVWLVVLTIIIVVAGGLM